VLSLQALFQCSVLVELEHSKGIHSIPGDTLIIITEK